MTAFTSYGAVDWQRQAESMRALGDPQKPVETDLLRQIFEMASRGLGQSMGRLSRTLNTATRIIGQIGDRATSP